MPTISTSMGAGVMTTAASPTPRSPSVAAFRSITTWPGASGAWPSAMRQGLSSESSTQLPARVGGPSPPIGSPSPETIWGMPSMAGSGAATPPTARTSSTVEAGRGWRCSKSSSPKLVSPRTTASVPALDRSNRSSKPASIVSVVVRVAARNVTPSTTAVHMPSSRRLWAHRPFNVRAIMTSAPEALHAVEHLVGARVRHLVDDAAVGEERDAVGVAGGARVVGHHDDGLAQVVDRVAQEGEELGART